MPTELTFLKASFCEDHLRYLLLVWDVLREDGYDEPYIRSEVLWVAQVLVMPRPGFARFYAVEGGRA